MSANSAFSAPRHSGQCRNSEENQKHGHADPLPKRDRFVQQGAALPLSTPDAFGKFIEAESARYGDIIRRAGIKLE